MTVTGDIKYIGVKDHNLDLFEGIYTVKNGMSYNSYAIIDEKIAIMDTVDEGFTEEWLKNIENLLGERTPDYLIVQHMEPDHSANIMNFMKKYHKAVLVASEKAFMMMKNFFGTGFSKNRIIVSDGDVISLGKHTLMFATAPMVHWPEVIVTYDSTDKVLFSADAFGTFGVSDNEDDWISEARRYYFGIVGKYGVQVQNMIKKLEKWKIDMICPLHGAVLTKNIEYYINLYNTWASYKPEEEGILIAYTSVYGHTKKTALLLEEKLKEKGYLKINIRDLARDDMSEIIAQAFRYNKLVLATTTYNADIFPPMREFINSLIERNFSNRMVALIENGSWAPNAAKIMRDRLEKCKNIVFTETLVKIMSVLSEENIVQLDFLADELCKDFIIK